MKPFTNKFASCSCGATPLQRRKSNAPSRKKSKGYYGGTVAAPVFKRIAQKIQGLSPTIVEINKKDIDNLF